MHLNSLPITLLKIDKSFVAGMRERAENRQLVRAMINLAHNLDLQVVAEGVEDEEQLALLQQYGCDQAQGYLISRPQPLPELLRFLLQGQRQALLGALPR
ncbi:Phytochrome-like protein cph2 [compost metagenome]